jgi:hypothetical protein
MVLVQQVVDPQVDLGAAKGPVGTSPGNIGVMDQIVTGRLLVGRDPIALFCIGGVIADGERRVR